MSDAIAKLQAVANDKPFPSSAILFHNDAVAILARITRLEDALRRIVGHYGSNAEGETEAMRVLAREALDQ